MTGLMVSEPLRHQGATTRPKVPDDNSTTVHPTGEQQPHPDAGPVEDHQQQNRLAGASKVQAVADAAAEARTAPAAEGKARSLLDRYILQQMHSQALLLPNHTNISALHMPGEDLIDLIRLQQGVQDRLCMTVPLLDGVFVLASAADLTDTAQDFTAASTGVRDSSSTPSVPGSQPSEGVSAAAAVAVPWRLRQVSGVQLHPSRDPADATLLLVGGSRVRAGAVKQGCLADADDPQELCCELASWQQLGRLRQLRVHDAAHISWRLHLAVELEVVLRQHAQEQAQLLAAGYSQEFTTQASNAALLHMRSMLLRLPPAYWVEQQILPALELSPASPGQPLTAEQHTALLQSAAAAWQQYLQRKLAAAQLSASAQPQQPRQQQQQVDAAVVEQPPQAAGSAGQSPEQQCKQAPPSAAAAAPGGTCGAGILFQGSVSLAAPAAAASVAPLAAPQAELPHGGTFSTVPGGSSSGQGPTTAAVNAQQPSTKAAAVVAHGGPGSSNAPAAAGVQARQTLRELLQAAYRDFVDVPAQGNPEAGMQLADASAGGMLQQIEQQDSRREQGSGGEQQGRWEHGEGMQQQVRREEEEMEEAEWREEQGSKGRVHKEGSSRHGHRHSRSCSAGSGSRKRKAAAGLSSELETAATAGSSPGKKQRTNHSSRSRKSDSGTAPLRPSSSQGRHSSKGTGRSRGRSRSRTRSRSSTPDARSSQGKHDRKRASSSCSRSRSRSNSPVAGKPTTSYHSGRATHAHKPACMRSNSARERLARSRSRSPSPACTVSPAAAAIVAATAGQQACTAGQHQCSLMQGPTCRGAGAAAAASGSAAAAAAATAGSAAAGAAVAAAASAAAGAAAVAASDTAAAADAAAVIRVTAGKQGATLGKHVAALSKGSGAVVHAPAHQQPGQQPHSTAQPQPANTAQGLHVRQGLQPSQPAAQPGAPAEDILARLAKPHHSSAIPTSASGPAATSRAGNTDAAASASAMEGITSAGFALQAAAGTAAATGTAQMAGPAAAAASATGSAATAHLAAAAGTAGAASVTGAAAHGAGYFGMELPGTAGRLKVKKQGSAASLFWTHLVSPGGTSKVTKLVPRQCLQKGNSTAATPAAAAAPGSKDTACTAAATAAAAAAAGNGPAGAAAAAAGAAGTSTTPTALAVAGTEGSRAAALVASSCRGPEGTPSSTLHAGAKITQVTKRAADPAAADGLGSSSSFAAAAAAAAPPELPASSAPMRIRLHAGSNPALPPAGKRGPTLPVSSLQASPGRCEPSPPPEPPVLEAPPPPPPPAAAADSAAAAAPAAAAGPQQQQQQHKGACSSGLACLQDLLPYGSDSDADEDRPGSDPTSHSDGKGPGAASAAAAAAAVPATNPAAATAACGPQSQTHQAASAGSPVLQTTAQQLGKVEGVADPGKGQVGLSPVQRLSSLTGEDGGQLGLQRLSSLTGDEGGQLGLHRVSSLAEPPRHAVQQQGNNSTTVQTVDFQGRLGATAEAPNHTALNAAAGVAAAAAAAAAGGAAPGAGVERQPVHAEHTPAAAAVPAAAAAVPAAVAAVPGAATAALAAVLAAPLGPQGQGGARQSALWQAGAAHATAVPATATASAHPAGLHSGNGGSSRPEAFIGPMPPPSTLTASLAGGGNSSSRLAAAPKFIGPLGPPSALPPALAPSKASAYAASAVAALAQVIPVAPVSSTTHNVAGSGRSVGPQPVPGPGTIGDLATATLRPAHMQHAQPVPSSAPLVQRPLRPADGPPPLAMEHPVGGPQWNGSSSRWDQPYYPGSSQPQLAQPAAVQYTPAADLRPFAPGGAPAGPPSTSSYGVGRVMPMWGAQPRDEWRTMPVEQTRWAPPCPPPGSNPQQQWQAPSSGPPPVAVPLAGSHMPYGGGPPSVQPPPQWGPPVRPVPPPCQWQYPPAAAAGPPQHVPPPGAMQQVPAAMGVGFQGTQGGPSVGLQGMQGGPPQQLPCGAPPNGMASQAGPPLPPHMFPPPQAGAAWQPLWNPPAPSAGPSQGTYGPGLPPVPPQGPPPAVPPPLPPAGSPPPLPTSPPGAPPPPPPAPWW